MEMEPRSNRVLILAPTGNDGAVLKEIFANEGIAASVCDSMELLRSGIEEGAGTAIIAEEALSGNALMQLAETINSQPEWSDFPMIIMAGAGSDPDMTWAVLGGGKTLNAAVLKRPVLTKSLLIAVRASLRSRNQQYRIAEELRRRKQAEEDLRRNEEFLRIATEAARIGTFEYDPVSNSSKWSQGLEKLYGLPTGGYDGSYEQWKSMVFPNDLPNVEKHLREAINETGRFETEWRIVRPDGVTRWMAARGLVFRDYTGKPVRLLGVNIDITERRRAEEALRDSETRYRLLFENISEGFALAEMIWDDEGNPVDWRYLDVNQAWGQTGIPANETIGRTAREVNPHIEPYWIETYGRVVQTGRSVSYENYAAGFGKWFATFVFKHSENRFGMLFLDITERKKAEQALQHRTEELASTNRDLESFSYSVSHDLRNPLHTIGGFVEFLTEDYAEQLDEEGRDFLRRINDGVTKMQRLIDDILNLSRIGRQEMKRENIDLSTIVRNYLDELKSTDPGRQAEFIIKENVHANGDPRLIHLALENLLRNAWKFTEKKEVTRIGFGTSVKDNQTVYFIDDNGTGFDMKFARTIFEPFKRVHPEKEFGGTGVGLSIVKRVVERHGGKVWAEGRPGEGATFYFTLFRLSDNQ